MIRYTENTEKIVHFTTYDEKYTSLLGKIRQSAGGGSWVFLPSNATQQHYWTEEDMLSIGNKLKELNKVMADNQDDSMPQHKGLTMPKSTHKTALAFRCWDCEHIVYFTRGQMARAGHLKCHRCGGPVRACGQTEKKVNTWIGQAKSNQETIDAKTNSHQT